MMHMVRNGVYFFRDDSQGKVLGKKPPEFITKGIGAMCAIPVMPYSTMGTHDYHAVHKCRDQQFDGKVFEYEQEQERR
jgi:hypothetical protein